VPEITDEMMRKDRLFWAQYQTRLTGNWITDDTSIKEIGDWAIKTYQRWDLDGYTGEASNKKREEWSVMQQMIRQDAHAKVIKAWPLGGSAGMDAARERLELAMEGLRRYEHEIDEKGRKDQAVDDIYLRLRQAIEESLKTLPKNDAVGEAAWALFDNKRSKRRLPRDHCIQLVNDSAWGCNFEVPLPDSVSGANPNKVRSSVQFEGSANLRPLCAAHLLAAVNLKDHPFRRLGEIAPRWIHQLEHIAAVAGSEVHGNSRSRGFDAVINDFDLTVKTLSISFFTSSIFFSITRILYMSYI